MTATTPPAVGTTGWGTPLNDYLQNTLQAEANSNATLFANHVSASPTPTTLTDPHGDRAYAQGLIQAIISGANLANGFLQLTAMGAIPSSLLPTLSGLGGLGLLETTTQTGTALNNTTQQFFQWTAPADGNLHRVMLHADLNITSVLTGGSIQLNYTSPANTSVIKSVSTQTAVGEYVLGPLSFLIKSGSTVTLAQSAAMSAGAAVLYAELWGL